MQRLFLWLFVTMSDTTSSGGDHCHNVVEETPMKRTIIKAVLQIGIILLTVTLMGIVHKWGGLFYFMEGGFMGFGWSAMNIVEMRFPSTKPPEPKEPTIINMSFTELAENSQFLMGDKELCKALLVFKDRMDDSGNIKPKPSRYPGVIPPPNTKVYLN